MFKFTLIQKDRLKNKKLERITGFLDHAYNLLFDWSSGANY